MSRGTRVRSGEKQVSATGLSPSEAHHSRLLRLPASFITLCGTLPQPRSQSLRFGLVPFRSPLLRESRLLSLPLGTKMFQFPRLSQWPYGFRRRCHPSSGLGFPHSGISGSQPVYGSPKHIGVRPVLHRLLAPRHPPCALSCFSSYSHQRRCVSLDYFPVSNFQGASRYHEGAVTKNPSACAVWFLLVELSGIEPLAPCMQGRCSPR